MLRSLAVIIMPECFRMEINNEVMEMMQDMIFDLLTAGDKKEKEKVYRRLERIGVDRTAADNMAAEFYRKGSDEV